MIKRIVSCILLLVFISSPLMAYPPTPEAFLDHLERESHFENASLSKMGMFVGTTVLGSSFLMRQEKYKTPAYVVGGVFLAGGLFSSIQSGQLEKKIKKLREKESKSAYDIVESIKKSERNGRYLVSAFMLIPVFISDLNFRTLEDEIRDLIHEPDPDNDHDENVLVKSMFVGFSLYNLFVKTPLEEMCEEVLSGYSSDLSLDFKPSLDTTKLALTYRF